MPVKESLLDMWAGIFKRTLKYGKILESEEKVRPCFMLGEKSEAQIWTWMTTDTQLVWSKMSLSERKTSPKKLLRIDEWGLD